VPTVATGGQRGAAQTSPKPSDGGKPAATNVETKPAGSPKDAFLAEVKAGRPTFYNMVVAQAFRIDVSPAAVVFAFQPNQKVPRQQCEEARAWLEGIAARVLGQRVPVKIAVNDVSGATPEPAPAASARSSDDALRQEAMADPTVQALFEIFPVEKTRIEEM
jgi:hypothetical protein